MENKNDIEDLFKKSFDNYEPEVRPKVWENVKIGLKWGSLGLFLNALMNKVGTATLIAVASTVVAVIGTVTYLNLTGDKGQNPEASKIVVAPEVKPDSNMSDAADANALVSQKTEDNTMQADTKETESKAEPANESVATISVNTLSGTAPLIVDFANAGTGKTNKWIFSNSKKTSTSTNLVHVFEKPGKYSVRLISADDSGKEDVDVVTIEVLESTPTIYKFSPDGDGVSDTLKLDPKGIASVDVKIFDTDGNILFKTEGTVGAYWDGKDLQGKETPKGNYFIMINATTPKGKKVEQKGIVKLVK